MAGLDVTEKAQIYPEEFEIIRQVGNPVAKTVAEWFDFFFLYHKALGYRGAAVHDAVAVAAITHPEIFEVKDMYVEVETEGDYCKGATIGDIKGKLGKAPNAHVLWNLDRDAFAKILIDAVKTYGEVAE
ncbi:Pyrimidine-specific ribonucleoside hydrolase RihA [bioreactor metagenome]|uniref:Pyrimidine-specific ribonucleoside hydrolase RihA n=1 Tax=bioreactor metagenome TaxID=1076179 RepID=A0A645HBS6_9ZZZZ